MNYSTLVETKLVEIHQEKESKLDWDMDYFISRWGVNWDNKITVNLKGKNDNQVSGKNDLYADYLLIETLKNIISKEKNKEEIFLIITFHFYF